MFKLWLILRMEIYRPTKELLGTGEASHKNAN